MSKSPKTVPDPNDLSQIAQLVVDNLDGTDIEEFEFRLEDFRVRVVRDPNLEPLTSSGTMVDQASGADTLSIFAPLTGVYYAKPAPEQPPFVSVGSAVTVGQVVALIETMKLFNEVVSEISGTVVDVLGTEGELVEKGQALIRLNLTEDQAPDPRSAEGIVG